LIILKRRTPVFPEMRFGDASEIGAFALVLFLRNDYTVIRDCVSAINQHDYELNFHSFAPETLGNG